MNKGVRSVMSGCTRCTRCVECRVEGRVAVVVVDSRLFEYAPSQGVLSALARDVKSRELCFVPQVEYPSRETQIVLRA